MPTRNRLKISNVILCDDIRTENNNKLILIGVYSNDLIVSDFPANMRLALYLSVEGAPLGEHDFEIRITSTGSKSGITGTVLVEDTKAPLVIVMPPVPVMFLKAGILKADFKIADGKWLTLVTKNVSAREEANHEELREGVS